jgi:hypothetical protein
MSFDLPDDELERQLGTMLRERASAVSQRLTVDRKVIMRARRRHTAKVASLGSGFALAVAIVAVAAVSFTGSPTASPSKTGPAAPGGGLHVQISVPTTVPTALPPAPSGWWNLPPAPIGARAASATAIVDDAFVVWGGEGQAGQRPMDGAWYDLRSGQWNVMSASPLPRPAYSVGEHFVVGQAVGDSVVIVSDGAAAEYTPRTNRWRHLPDVPLSGLDNLALASPNGTNAVVLTGIDRAGRPSYAALDFDVDNADPVWTIGSLTGRSIGRPVLFKDGFWVLAHAPDGGVRLDVVYGLQGPAGVANVPKVASTFVPTVWDGTNVYGAECQGCRSTAITVLDVSSALATSVNDAYSACAGLHVWTGREVVSWGSTTCDASSVDIAYNPTTGEVTKLPPTIISERRAADFAVANDGSVYIWGGEDVHGKMLDDGAVLTLP